MQPIKTLEVRIKDCYGIKSFSYTFNFSPRRKTYIIYARNATMKTSFLKTLRDYQHNRQSRDIITHKIGKKTIKGVDRRQIRTYTSYEEYRPVYTLQFFIRNLNQQEKQLWESLKQELEFHKYLQNIESDSLENLLKDIFLFILFTSVGEQAYWGQVNDLTEQHIRATLPEPLLVIFDPAHYEPALIALGFPPMELNSISLERAKQSNIPLVFKAFLEFLQHLELITPEGSIDLNAYTDLGQRRYLYIKSLLNYIYYLIDPDKYFAEVNDSEKIYLITKVVPKYPLSNIPRTFFHKIAKQREIFISISQKAHRFSQNRGKGRYSNIAAEFNTLFLFPFSVELQFRKEFGDTMVYLQYGTNGKIDLLGAKDVGVLNALSDGERKALYLLQIMTEVETLNPEEEYLLVLDDIVESFDYRNKYAISTYLYKIALKKNLKLIILTHNYDFFRTLGRRFKSSTILAANGALVANRDSAGAVRLNPMDDWEPWQVWKKRLEEDDIVALIPFVRSLIKVTSGSTGSNKDCELLSKTLHYSGRSPNTTYNDLLPIYRRYLQITGFPPSVDLTKSIWTTINDFTYAPAPLQKISDDLKAKIIFAIRLRFKAEEYLYMKLPKLIPGTNLTDLISFGELYGKFLNWFLNNATEKQKQQMLDIKLLLDKIFILTPEHLHARYWEYETLIDTDIAELIEAENKLDMLINNANGHPKMSKV